MERPSLHIHFLAHPKSAQGRILAEQLMDHFVEPPATGGLRIPVFFTPDRGDGLPPRLTGRDALDLEAADHSIVVVLTDARMAQRVGPLATAQAWQQFIEEMITKAPERYGVSVKHQRALADEIHLYLLLAGLRIAYGGALKGDFDKASNFTLALFELVRGYAKLADAVQAHQFHPIVNHAPWPLRLEYGEAEWQLFGREAVYCEGPRPAIPWTDDEIFPVGGAGWRFAPNTPEKRYAWARGLTAMRRQMTEQVQARVLIGGNLITFMGVVPGVVEEAWWSLTHQQPLYVVLQFSTPGPI